MSAVALLGVAFLLLVCVVLPAVVGISATMLSARISESERRAGLTDDE